MIRTLIALAVLILTSFLAPLRADTQLLVSGFPTEYNPGSSFSFDVKFGGIPGPGQILTYSIAMNFSAGDPSQLLVEVNKPGDLSTFVFGTSDSILLSASGLGVSDLAFTFSGSQLLLPGDPPPQPADVVVGQNDILGTITVTPGLGFTGPITLLLNRQVSSFDTGGEAISFTVPGAATAQQGEVAATPVPAPAAWMLMSMGLAVLAVRRTRAA